jgi:hypothetical protein
VNAGALGRNLGFRTLPFQTHSRTVRTARTATTSPTKSGRRLNYPRLGHSSRC